MIRGSRFRLPDDAPLERLLYQVYVMCCIEEAERDERAASLALFASVTT